ncbi:TPA: AmmeMemoRadiSam system protein A [Candidatus Acetothermia bacterium]|nr:AmmeMemoRadiSam system protein A [Candidatus Acetothermia bacterium]
MRELLLGAMVIGLAAILLTCGLRLNQEKAPAAGTDTLKPLSLFESEQVYLLQLARRHLEAVLSGGSPMVVDSSHVSKRLNQHAACFVSLFKGEQLRGCMIDDFQSHEPLVKNVRRNAVLAATGDERFSPVTIGELDAIRIEISVLDVPQVLKFEGPDDLLEKLHPGADGVVLTTEAALSTYLPHIWETYPDPAEFLSHLCEKQGAAADCWKRNPLPQIEIYHVLHFKEGESPH